MKKIIAILLVFSIMLLSNVAYGKTVDKPELFEDCTNSHLTSNMLVTTDAVNPLPDGVSLKVVDDPALVEPYCGIYEYMWDGTRLIGRCNVYDNFAPMRKVSKQGFLYILDTDLNITDTLEFDDYICEMAYVENMYYITVNNRLKMPGNTGPDIPFYEKVFSSPDLKTWTERPELKHVPVTNGKVTLNAETGKAFVFNNNKRTNEIVYESVALNEAHYMSAEQSIRRIVASLGGYFVIMNNEYANNFMHDWQKNIVWISKDGIYFTAFILPDDLWVYDIESSEKGINFCYGPLMTRFISYENIEQQLATGDTYIKLNDKFLGFETPPVIEDGRTLVPMRFLFEQMGADVGWYDQYKMVVAQKNGLSVEVSIDSKIATVNGETVELDTPPRMINGKTMIPLRFLSENLGYKVSWDDKTRIASIVQ